MHPVRGLSGHVMGAKMERDMRQELFEHYQKLSFSFYDRQRTGHLMSRITNDPFEIARFNYENNRFLASRSDGYRSEAWFDAGMKAFTQLITIAVIVFGAAGIARSSLDLADLLTFLLCVAVLVDPIQRLVN